LTRDSRSLGKPAVNQGHTVSKGLEMSNQF
jgi:hypothetical protein